MSVQHHAWAGTVRQFLALNVEHLLTELVKHHQSTQTDLASSSQQHAWRSSIDALKKALQSLSSDPKHNVGNWAVIFEYELPRERGRRPDVVLLGYGWVLLLEFKDFTSALPQHLDQVSAYVRDLSHYHSECDGKAVFPLLVLTRSTRTPYREGDVEVTSGVCLAEAILKLVPTIDHGSLLELNKWLAGDYAPLPSLVNAARQIFEHEPLPSIRRAQSAGIPQTVAELVSIAQTAKQNSQRHLALVTGVPGAGKTLVGLQFVYENHFGEASPEKSAVLLSGNGPLVNVLKHALRSSVFVQDVHGFLRQYGGSSSRSPIEHIWVYDEAQRAWDAERVAEKRGHNKSEPEDFLSIGNKVNDWAMMVGLIGEGQEIHLGEEAGLKQWNDAIRNVGGGWIVHCPSKISHIFDAVSGVQKDDRLDLTQSLRSHLAEDVQSWIKALLDGDFASAKTLAEKSQDQGFCLYLTRDLQVAKKYVTERYFGEIDKRYGLLASSKGKNLPNWEVQNSYGFTKNLREGPWYNDPPTSKYSCCQLHDVATEFACQGLELDLPIVCWGNDLVWSDGKWKSPRQARSKAHNPHQLRVNSYRVLLSRGRDGMVIFVPPDIEMDSTAEALSASGLKHLT